MSPTFDFRPAPPSGTPTSIQALKSWMQDSGCNFLGYRIGEDNANDGHILRAEDGHFTWSYGERGNVEQIETFNSEAAAVAYAFTQIASDRWACSHIVGFTKDLGTAGELTHALQDRGIAFFQDSIPYGGPDDPRYRLFVHGKFADAVSDLRAEFHRIE